MPDVWHIIHATGTRWACGHARFGELSKLSWSELLRLVNERTLKPDYAAQEIGERKLRCAACRNQDRRIRRAWGIVILAALVVLFVGWRLHG